MDTQELISEMSLRCKLPQESTSEMVYTVIQAMINCAKNLDSVAIPGFGTFVAEKQEEYVSEEDERGHRYLMPPHIGLSFKTSVVLRKKIVG